MTSAGYGVENAGSRQSLITNAIGYSSCTGRGSCRAGSRREGRTDVTKDVWGSGLARVRVSPESHSHGPKVSRQKLTCIHSTCRRAKVDLRIRRIQMIYCVVDSAVRFNIL